MGWTKYELTETIEKSIANYSTINILLMIDLNLLKDL